MHTATTSHCFKSLICVWLVCRCVYVCTVFPQHYHLANELEDKTIDTPIKPKWAAWLKHLSALMWLAGGHGRLLCINSHLTNKHTNKTTPFLIKRSYLEKRFEKPGVETLLKKCLLGNIQSNSNGCLPPHSNSCNNSTGNIALSVTNKSFLKPSTS